MDHILVPESKQLSDVGRSTVTQPNPNELRGRATQDGQSVKISVLADYQALALARQLPDGRIGRPSVPEQSDVERVRKQIRERDTQPLREWLVEKEPYCHLMQPVC
ncbi:MAG: hypothetical protein Q7R30_03440 [Acidobacteriota bacterium]|nr:hypothetical protein [Acidobacteriota bacterium]